MTVADFTTPGLIVPRLRGRTVPEVIWELSQALGRERRVREAGAFCDAVLKRERLVSTDTEAGIAFPHARSAELQVLSFAFGRAEPRLAWRAVAGDVIRFVFLLAVPADESAQYLQLISGLVRLSKDPGLMEGLEAALDAKQLLRVLSQVGVRGSGSPTPDRPYRML